MTFRTTRIYQKSLELVSESQAVIDQLPRGCAYLADQLRRAASSIVQNFAEGCGKSSHAERRRYFHTARASAYEVASVFDTAKALRVITPEHHARGLDLSDHVAAMLTRFAHKNA